MKNSKAPSEYIQVKMSLQAIIAGLVLATTFFLILLDLNKSYISTITILLVPKSETAIRNEKQITANVAQLPRLLSFYDTLLKFNPDVRDLAVGKSKDQRKKIWNSMLKIERPDNNSSIINVVIKSKIQADAELLSQKSARTLFDVSAQYYNIKSDIDFRVIEGPITKAEISGIWWILPLSIGLGFFIAILLQIAIHSFERKFKQKSFLVSARNGLTFAGSIFNQQNKKDTSLEELYKTEEIDVPFSFEQYTEPTQKSSLSEKEMEDINKHLQKNIYPNFPEMPTAPMASAPENLPVADEHMFTENILPSINEHEEKKKENIVHSEPTEGELKKRLNQLLKGEL